MERRPLVHDAAQILYRRCSLIGRGAGKPLVQETEGKLDSEPDAVVLSILVQTEVFQDFRADCGGIVFRSDPIAQEVVQTDAGAAQFPRQPDFGCQTLH